MSQLCDDCRAEWLSWLDYRPPRQVQLITVGEGRHRVSRGERIMETIRSQQALIVASCERKHGGGEMGQRKDREAAAAYEETVDRLLREKQEHGDLPPEGDWEQEGKG